MFDENVLWQRYLNTETDILNLSYYIEFTDNYDERFLNYFSNAIGDLLVKVGSQIEAVSKSLYKYLLKKMPKDKRAKFKQSDNAKLRYDDDCIKLVNKVYSSKNVEVKFASSIFDFKKKENQSVKPLDDICFQRGGWNKAYQSAKHDRGNSLPELTLKKLLDAYAALYLLNIYNMFGSGMEIVTGTMTQLMSFDFSFGSKLFVLNKPIYPLTNETIEEPSIEASSPFAVMSSDLELDLFCGRTEKSNPLLEYVTKQLELKEKEFTKKINPYKLFPSRDNFNFFQLLYSYRLDKIDKNKKGYDAKLSCLKSSKEYKRFEDMNVFSKYINEGEWFYDLFKMEIAEYLGNDDIKKNKLEGYICEFSRPYSIRIPFNLSKVTK